MSDAIEVRPLSQEQKEACGYLAHHVLGSDGFTAEHARIILALLANYERRHKADAAAITAYEAAKGGGVSHFPNYEAYIRSALTSPASGERDAVIEVTDAMVEAAEASVYPRHERGFLIKPLIDAIDMRAALTAALRMEGK